MTRAVRTPPRVGALTGDGAEVAGPHGMGSVITLRLASRQEMCSRLLHMATCWRPLIVPGFDATGERVRLVMRLTLTLKMASHTDTGAPPIRTSPTHIA